MNPEDGPPPTSMGRGSRVVRKDREDDVVSIIWHQDPMKLCPTLGHRRRGQLAGGPPNRRTLIPAFPDARDLQEFPSLEFRPEDTPMSTFRSHQPLIRVLEDPRTSRTPCTVTSAIGHPDYTGKWVASPLTSMACRGLYCEGLQPTRLLRHLRPSCWPSREGGTLPTVRDSVHVDVLRGYWARW